MNFCFRAFLLGEECFDFLARADCKQVGARTTPEMVDLVIGKVGPDHIQIDCKGHPGFSSYPTKVGNPF